MKKKRKKNEKNSRFLPFFGILESWLKIDHFSLHKSSGKPLHVREPSNGKPLEASPYKYLCKGDFGKPFPTRMPASETWDHQRLQNENFGKLLPTKASNMETLGSPSLQNLKTETCGSFPYARLRLCIALENIERRNTLHRAMDALL